MPQTQAKVLYDNILRDHLDSNGLVFAGTPGVQDNPSGFGPENLTDWRDFTLFRVEGTGTGGTVAGTVASATTFDAVGVYAVVPQDTGVSFTITMRVNANPPFASLAFGDTGTASDMKAVRLVSISEVTLSPADVINIDIVRPAGVVVDIRQIVLGSELEFPRGQHVGMTPTVNQGGIIRKNIISVNGSIIASNVRRVEKKDTIDLDQLDPDWVRDTWNPFLTHCIRYPFIRQWNPVEYPSEVDWCAAQEIETPKNAHRLGRMSVSMPLHCLTR